MHIIIKIITTVILLIICKNGYNQIANLSNSLTVIHIGDSDSATHILLKCRFNIDHPHKQTLSINEDAYIIDKSTNHKYKLLNTINIPFEPSYHSPNNLDTVHYFSLTFQKLDNSSQEIELHSNSFVLNAIEINNNKFKNQEIDLINLLESTPVNEHGYYYKDGKLIKYLINKGIVIALNIDRISSYGEYLSAYISIENYNNRRVDFIPELIKFKINNDQNEINLISLEEYTSIVKKKQLINTFFVALGEYNDANSAGNTYINTNQTTFKEKNNFISGYFGDEYGYTTSNVRSYSNTNRKTQIYNSGVGYYARQSAKANIRDHQISQYEILESINQGYLKSNTLFQNQRINGYGLIKHIEYETLLIEIPIGNEIFKFEWENKVKNKNVKSKQDTPIETVPTKTNNEIIIDSLTSNSARKLLKYESIESVKIGDVVQYQTKYGDKIFGIVCEFGKGKNIKFKTYPSLGQEIICEDYYNKLSKIEP